ncbi:hypothetical protein GGF46_004373 [Coemansia sp. RSA 552]|nr:hypothetical protein GGF46_004373 [Coemansia sp. RSA 552]
MRYSGDSLLTTAAPVCPECSATIPIDSPVAHDHSSDAERLLASYYTLRRRHTAEARPPASLQKTHSIQSDTTVATVEDLRSSSPVYGLQPLVSGSSSASNSQQMAPRGRRAEKGRRDAELRAELVDGLVNDSSGSDTDLDLPEPASFLSQPSDDPGDRTPPPPTPTRRPAATYSATGTPRSASWRRSIRQQPTLPPSSPPPSRPLNAIMRPSKRSTSSMTAVDEPVTSRKAESSLKRRRSAVDKPSAAATKAAAAGTAQQREKNKKTQDTGSGADLVLLTTGLTTAQMSRLKRAAGQAPRVLGVSAAVCTTAEMLGRIAYTHLVTATGKGGRAARTFKYVAGVASGAWAVTVDWLVASVKAGRLLPEADYAVVGDTAMPQCSLSGPRSAGELLRGHAFHLWGGKRHWDAGTAHSYTDLLSLICLLGAKIDDELPEPAAAASDTADEDGEDQPGPPSLGDRCSVQHADKEIARLPPQYRRLFELPVGRDVTTVLVDSSDLQGARSSVTLGAVVARTGGVLACRTKTWLLDCISSNTIL